MGGARKSVYHNIRDTHWLIDQIVPQSIPWVQLGSEDRYFGDVSRHHIKGDYIVKTFTTYVPCKSQEIRAGLGTCIPASMYCRRPSHAIGFVASRQSVGRRKRNPKHWPLMWTNQLEGAGSGPILVTGSRWQAPGRPWQTPEGPVAPVRLCHWKGEASPLRPLPFLVFFGLFGSLIPSPANPQSWPPRTVLSRHDIVFLMNYWSK
jgi:hypothetical protein